MTHLARSARHQRSMVAWFRTEASDAEPSRFIAGLEGAFLRALPALPRHASSAEDLARGLEVLDGDRIVLFIDDFHCVDGSPGPEAIERLLQAAPRELSIVVASRSFPAINATRLRLADALIEIGPDALRFRSWEVEELFRAFYQQPLPPEELAELIGRTDGWAAGLQLFHLATKDATPSQRRGVLARLHRGSRLIREYLTRNLLQTLPNVLREFLIQTSVLGRLDADSCDGLLDISNSREVLEELARRQICNLESEGAEVTYRYHEVFRLHLETILIEQVGERHAKKLFGKAGLLLERSGAFPQALYAFSRADNHEAVQRLLGRRGRQLADRHGGWVTSLPTTFPIQDPWLQLASARHHRAAGRTADAVDAYRDAEAGFVGTTAAAVCRRERASLVAWLEPPGSEARDWAGALRLTTVKFPLQAFESQSPANEDFVAGIADLVWGDTSEARRSFAYVLASDVSPDLEHSAALGDIAARVLAGEFPSAEAENLADRAEQSSAGWFARIARALVGRSTDNSFEDPWGSLIASFFRGWSQLLAGEDAVSSFRRANEHARNVEARALEVWAGGGLALAMVRAGLPEGARQAIRAEREARLLGVRGAHGIAAMALAEAERSRNRGALVSSIENECHLVFPRPARAVHPQPLVGVEVRCFGAFAIDRNGVPIDLNRVRPLARRTLRLLAIHGGRPVHREVLIEAFWGRMDPGAATRNLQVAISSLRSALEGDARRPGPVIVRDGETYRLLLPEGSTFDVIAFERLLGDARRAHSERNAQDALYAAERALEIFADGLLPEEGPAEWILDERSRREAEAIELGELAARLYLGMGETLATARIAERLISIDRYRDSAWRLAIEAHDAGGDIAAAVRTRSRYKQMLQELDVVERTFSDATG
jgi:DNA-binding SARP family transcriptional activator